MKFVAHVGFNNSFSDIKWPSLNFEVRAVPFRSVGGGGTEDFLKGGGGEF